MKELTGLLFCCGITAALALTVSAAISWYCAGLQAEVYRRQGVEMTQWEVFIGMKTVERTINVK